MAKKFTYFPHNGDSCFEGQEEDEEFCLMFGPFVSCEEITWCQSEPSWDEVSACSMHYGNEATVQLYYQTAAILICIPQYTSGHSSVGSRATTSINEKFNEAMDICFPKLHKQ